MVAGVIKRNLHRDICRDPVLHSLVLNLYLNGEDYPHRVDDYFPVWAVSEPELLAAMKSHMSDEDKHVLLYKKAIRKLGQPVVELPLAEIYNEIIRGYTKHSFEIDESDTADERTFKLASFFAHLHFLEKRIARSLDYHLDACSLSTNPYAEKAVGIVAGDEQHHVQYTHQAVMHLLPLQRAKEILEEHRLAEARANLDFSARQLILLTDQYTDHFPGFRRRIYRYAGNLLEWSLKYA